jgi:hypothetical protein
VTAGMPDLLVSYTVGSKEKTTDSFRDFFAYKGSGGDLSLQEAYVHGYREGYLNIFVMDTRTRHILWRGTASAAVKPEAQKKRVSEAVAKMFADFPSRYAAK